MIRLLSTNTPAVCLKDAPGESVVVEKKAATTGREPLLLCRQCRQVIARPSDRISVNGAHQHIFSNPQGLVYEIGCFQSVTGCAYAGPWSNEFTWFAGYSWRTLVCTGCLFHLGWSFSSGGGSHFYGLILDHLISPP
ncbi:MAG: cereblon family protein [Desulfobacterales bacterium]|jgi:hypothetical protein|nr:cereblon family protein [Desulfobacterales bacterium]